MVALSHSSSELLGALLHGPTRRGMAIGPRDFAFDGYVVSLTRPGSPRLPNGIECEVKAGAKDRVSIGQGRLSIGRLAVHPGPGWDPRPAVARTRVLGWGPPPMASPMMASTGLLCGYVAGLALLHDQRAMALRLAKEGETWTDRKASTLLRHAALGELPEPLHALLREGDAREALATPSLDGPGWIRGLISAGYSFDVRMLHATTA